jgi:C4-dicarboxylate-specific signal transduction histidine kinase
MSIVTILWSLNAALAFTLAGCCLLFWIVERRDLANLTFCVLALATAAATPLEIAMMHATTPAEYGELLRWYHLPIFFVLVAHLLFVRFYLGAGRPWLLWMVVGLRLVVLISNFFLDPNFNFREITSLQRISFLGEQVSVVGDSVARQAQWLAGISMILLVTFVMEAATQAWLHGSAETRRRAVIVGLAIVVPMIGNIVLNQLVVSGVLHIPISATLWFLGTLTVIAYDLGREVVISRRAQQQLANLRNELAQFDRVNTLGQFASGLAHELMQPLTATAGNATAAELLMQRPTPDLDELRAIVTDIQKDNQRAADTIHRMRALLQRRSLEIQPVTVDEVVRDVLSLAAPEADSRQVTLECRCAPTLPRVRCDRVQIAQVLLNLILNGMDAVKACASDRRSVRVEASTNGNGEIEIAVLDAGPGIPEGLVDAVFSPLYTTKAKGLGMGLTISRTIIEAHGGRLWASNNAETGGAAFRFTLPPA